MMMEEIVFKCLLALSLGFWFRGIAFVKAKPDLTGWRPRVSSLRHAHILLMFALVLALSNIVGLVGMYFEPRLFRWFFLISIIGKCIAFFIYEIQPNKTKQDNFVSFHENLFAGAILTISYL